MLPSRMAGARLPNPDLADLANLLGEENVRTLLGTFLSEYPTLLAQLSQGDRKLRHRIVHSLKSNTRIIGARELSVQMAELEARLGSPTGADIETSEIEALTTRFAAVAQELRDYLSQS